MSKATKRKHVTKEAVDEYYIPEGDEKIVKVICGRGNNLHEVTDADGKIFLVSMPTKFRKNVWIKRGDYCVVNPIDEGDKVCAEIVYILYGKQIKYLKEEKLWPTEFEEKKMQVLTANNARKDINDEDGSSDDSDGEPLHENLNRPVPVVYTESDDETSDEDGITNQP